MIIKSSHTILVGEEGLPFKPNQAKVKSPRASKDCGAEENESFLALTQSDFHHVRTWYPQGWRVFGAWLIGSSSRTHSGPG